MITAPFTGTPQTDERRLHWCTRRPAPKLWRRYSVIVDSECTKREGVVDIPENASKIPRWLNRGFLTETSAIYFSDAWRTFCDSWRIVSIARVARLYLMRVILPSNKTKGTALIQGKQC